MGTYLQSYIVAYDTTQPNPAYHHCAKKASNHHANLPLEMYSFTL